VKRKSIFFLGFLLIFAMVLSPSPQKKISPKNLPPQHRKWLEEDVVYIITPKEKDVFLRLETDREREIFIEAFWKARDPDLITPENEFKKEHYRRIKYADQKFGREGPGAGWRMAMGKIYILLGEPAQIYRLENDSEIYPVVTWFYQGMTEYGLPNSFYVAFFKRSGMGEYELYSPVRDGPQSLIIHFRGDPGDYLSAYNKLYGIDPAIAEISMTLIPDESGKLASPSIASEILVTSKIPSAPGKKVEDDYAVKLLAYKDIIEVDYTANYIPCDAYAEVIRDAGGLYFVHYLIEPKKLTFDQIGNRFRANLEVTGRVADLQGNAIYQFDRSAPIEFNQDQLNNIKDKLFSFQDLFPLAEGNYKLNVLLKNTVSKEFTSMEQDVFIPGPAAGMRMSRLVLGNKIIRNSEYRGTNKPFLFGDLQLVPSPRNDFAPQDKLYLYFQVTGLSRDLLADGSLEYAILKEGEKVFSAAKALKDHADPVNFFEEFSLVQLGPAYYKIKVSLHDQAGNEVLFEQKDFVITYLPALPRPWVLSIPQPPSEDFMYVNILGNQYLNKKDTGKAKSLLGEAYHKNTRSKKFALDYCRILFMDKEYPRVKEVAAPFLQSQEKYEFLSLLGQSSQAVGELAEAISFYKEYLSHYGTNILILNSIGECYHQMGNPEEALIAWEKSLEMNPEQENIRKLVDSIKKKK